MKLKYISTLLLGLFLAGACNKEDDIIPTEGDELAFVLPQGDHDYDADLVRYHKKYGFLPVYIFTDRDLFWNNTEWVGGTLRPDETGGSGKLLGKAGNPDYVGKQWELCKDLFFTCYPDSVINMLPLKFFLCAELNTRSSVSTGLIDDNGLVIYKYDTTRILACKGFDYLAVNLGSPAIDTISDLTKLNFSRELNTVFLNYLHKDKKLFTMPQEFGEVSDYKPRWLFRDEPLREGFLSSTTLNQSDKTGEKSKANDFNEFMSLVAIPLEILEKERAPTPSGKAASLEGALNPKFDTNGLVRKKYEILIKYLKEEHGINTDLLQYPNLK